MFVHQSADTQAVAVGLVRGASEYQCQKYSAASRAYIPKFIWNDVKDRVVAMMDDVSMGTVQDFGNFVNAIIDHSSCP